MEVKYVSHKTIGLGVLIWQNHCSENLVFIKKKKIAHTQRLHVLNKNCLRQTKIHKLATENNNETCARNSLLVCFVCLVTFVVKSQECLLSSTHRHVIK